MTSGLLRERAFRHYWAAQTVSFVGDEITTIAVPLLAIGVGATPIELGTIVAAQWLPSLLFGVAAGAWADRRSRRRHVMIAADAGRAMLLASVPVAWLLGVTAIGHLVAVAFGIGLLGVLLSVSNAALPHWCHPPATSTGTRWSAAAARWRRWPAPAPVARWSRS